MMPRSEPMSMFNAVWAEIERLFYRAAACSSRRATIDRDEGRRRTLPGV
jgi:hypothetical protein